MSVTTETNLQLTIMSKNKSVTASDTAKEIDVTPATAVAEVPVTRSEAGGIKERINQINAALASGTTSQSTPAERAAYNLRAETMYIPHPEDYDETYITAKVDKISAAKMTIVETENIYDYRNA